MIASLARALWSHFLKSWRYYLIVFPLVTLSSFALLLFWTMHVSVQIAWIIALIYCAGMSLLAKRNAIKAGWLIPLSTAMRAWRREGLR